MASYLVVFDRITAPYTTLRPTYSMRMRLIPSMWACQRSTRETLST